MLALTTKRPTFDLTVDGKERHIPITLGLSEYKSLYEASSAAGDGKDAGIGSIDWFVDFARTYLGDDVDKLSGDDIVELMREWFAARSEHGQPDMGERSASRA